MRSITMKYLFHRKYAYVALLVWLFASLSGMHGHYCFDGKEPPVSVHFDMVSEHEHADEAEHNDFDSKASAFAMLKIFNLDLPFLAAALCVLLVWPLVRRQAYAIANTPYSWLVVTNLRPPLRAPPVISNPV